MQRLLPLLLLAVPGTAFAEVNRCDLPDGQIVYTDRTCASIGARERVPGASVPQLRSYRPACPRTLRDLAYEVTAAIDAHDVNRLAGVYLWSGLGTRQGYALMDRLQAVVDRPLVDLQPVYAGEEDAYAPTRPPVALRVEQTSVRGSTPVQAQFGLRKHLGCWWIVEGGTRAPASAGRTASVDAVPSGPAAAVD